MASKLGDEVLSEIYTFLLLMAVIGMGGAIVFSVIFPPLALVFGLVFVVGAFGAGSFPTPRS